MESIDSMMSATYLQMVAKNTCVCLQKGICKKDYSFLQMKQEVHFLKFPSLVGGNAGALSACTALYTAARPQPPLGAAQGLEQQT